MNSKDNKNNCINDCDVVGTMKTKTEGNNVDESLTSSLSSAIDDLDVKINLLKIKKQQKYQGKENLDDSLIISTPNINGIYRNSLEISSKSLSSTSLPKRQIQPTPVKKTKSYLPRRMFAPRTRLNFSKTMDTTVSSAGTDGIGSVNEKSLETGGDIPEEVEHFLDIALGNEANITTSPLNNSTASDSAYSSSTKHRSPFSRKFSRFLSRPFSTSDVSEYPASHSNYSRSSSEQFCGVGLKGKSILDEYKDKMNIEITNLIDKSRELKIEHLRKQIRIQQSVMCQAGKALECCHSQKEFMASIELVESERLLLLAGLQKDVLLEELKQMSYTNSQVIKLQKQDQYKEYGEVEMNGFRLTLHSCMNREPEIGEIKEWFVIVITQGTNVWMSPATPSPVNHLLIDFDTFSCNINQLQPDSKIKIEVYSLKLETGIVYEHKEKYRIGAKMKNISKKLFKKAKQPEPPKIFRPMTLTSSFTFAGCLELSISDFSLISPWQLSSVPKDSYLLGTIDFNLNFKFHLDNRYEGYISRGEDMGRGIISWSRKWCTMNGHMLTMANSIGDQEIDLVIDLMRCITHQVCPISKTFCSKPRTILIETIRQRDPDDVDDFLHECFQQYTIDRHLLSFDTTRELVDWIGKLNSVLARLRRWNIIPKIIS